MRVCIDGDGGVPNGSYDRSSVDINGNYCNWTQCYVQGALSDGGNAGGVSDAGNLHFGGCLTNTTAGSLCCCK